MSKLVRDKIPEIVVNEGKEKKFEQLSDEQFEFYLKKKLLEETDELFDAMDKEQDKEVEEWGDVIEVMEALMKRRKISREEVEERRKRKAEERGAFEKKILMVE